MPKREDQEIIRRRRSMINIASENHDYGNLEHGTLGFENRVNHRSHDSLISLDLMAPASFVSRKVLNIYKAFNFQMAPGFGHFGFGVPNWENQDSDYNILHSENDNIHLLNHDDRGLELEANDIKIGCMISSREILRSIKKIDQLNIIGSKQVQIGDTVNVVLQTEGTSASTPNIGEYNTNRAVEEADTLRSTHNLEENAIIRAVTQAVGISESIQDSIERITVIESEVQLGTRINFITQIVKPEQGIRGRTPLPNLESGTTKPKKCNSKCCNASSIAVFVCWSVIVGCGIVFQVAYKFSGENQNNPISFLELNITECWYMDRKSWKAEVPRNRIYLDTPIHYVIIVHSGFNYCDEKDTCSEKVLAMQRRDKIEKLWVDIGPNFHVSGNGLIFEGRGANVQGATLSEFNEKSVTIMFLGDYERNQTSPEQFDHLNVLLTELMNEGVLAKDYSLLGECQISEEPLVSPGPNVMDELESMEHWHSGKTEACYGALAFWQNRSLC